VSQRSSQSICDDECGVYCKYIITELLSVMFAQLNDGIKRRVIGRVGDGKGSS